MNEYPDSRNGGIETITLLLGNEFQKRGVNVHVLYLNPVGLKDLKPNGFSDCTYISDRGRLIDIISDYIRDNNIKIVINQNILSLTGSIRNALHKNACECKVITVYHNKPTHTSLSLNTVLSSSDLSFFKKGVISVLFPIFRWISNRKLAKTHQMSYKQSDYTVLLSSRYISEYCEMYGVDNKKLVAINNPINDRFSISSSDKKQNVILMVVRLDEQQKCIKKALNTWSEISPLIPDWEFHIVGSGPDEKLVKDYAVKLGLSRVRFYPAGDPIDHYRKASIFLMTSRNEGWPCTLNEAMHMGCVPVVLATFSAIYDIIDDGRNGLIVAPEGEDQDVSNLCRAIRHLIEDQSSMRKMSAHAIEKSEKLCAKEISQKWIHLFENL